MIVAFLMILACVAPAFAADTNDSAEYAVNSNGETYGNYLEALEIGYEADLIYAEGIDGTLGYMRASDLDDGVMFPSDVAPQTVDRIIPLYASDGITVVGQFLISAEGAGSSQTRADYTYSKYNQMDPPGYTAYGRSGIMSVSGGVMANTTVTTSMSVPINWIGIQARCYRKSNGALVKSSNWEYNGNSTTSHSHNVTYKTIFSNYEFYSCGGVKVWNSEISDYWSYYTFDSPIAKPG